MNAADVVAAVVAIAAVVLLVDALFGGPPDNPNTRPAISGS